jgi:hypothetical protein
MPGNPFVPFVLFRGLPTFPQSKFTLPTILG